MKTFLKWAAVGLGVLILLVVFGNQDKLEQMFSTLAIGLGWMAYIITKRLEGIRVDIARLQNDVYTLMNNSKFAEEVLLDLKRDAG